MNFTANQVRACCPVAAGPAGAWLLASGTSAEGQIASLGPDWKVRVEPVTL
ncbi:MAG TPA: hypothetical protein VFE09_02940 [Rubrobacteraceae bacterium]|nr:hypothetical protein [Rubrobacteraceae bacterium]